MHQVFTGYRRTDERVLTPGETFRRVIDLGFYVPGTPVPGQGEHKRNASRFMCHSIRAAEAAAFIKHDDRYAALAAIREYADDLNIDAFVGFVQSLKERYGLDADTTQRLLTDIYEGWEDRPRNITEFETAYAEYREASLTHVE